MLRRTRTARRRSAIERQPNKTQCGARSTERARFKHTRKSRLGTAAAAAAAAAASAERRTAAGRILGSSWLETTRGRGGTSQFGGWQLECSADAGTRLREKWQRRRLCLLTIRSKEESRTQRVGKGKRVRQQPGMKLFMKKSLAWVGTRPDWRAILEVERPDNTRRRWSLVAGDWLPITR